MTINVKVKTNDEEYVKKLGDELDGFADDISLVHIEHDGDTKVCVESSCSEQCVVDPNSIDDIKKAIAGVRCPIPKDGEENISEENQVEED